MTDDEAQEILAEIARDPDTNAVLRVQAVQLLFRLRAEPPATPAWAVKRRGRAGNPAAVPSIAARRSTQPHTPDRGA